MAMAQKNLIMLTGDVNIAIMPRRKRMLSKKSKTLNAVLYVN